MTESSAPQVSELSINSLQSQSSLIDPVTRVMNASNDSESAPLMNGNAGAETSPIEQFTETGPTQTNPTSEDHGMSANEIALYDRQIRLWGKQAQEKIRTASVLLIGLKGLGNEVAKNLVLAGIGSLTIVDNGIVTEEDLGAQFLIREEHIGINRAQAASKELQALNPRVKLFIENSSVVNLALTPAYFHAFNIVIATDLTIDLLQPLNAACRLAPRPFYASGTFGLFGYIFADLVTHTFKLERDRSNIPTKIGPESLTRSIVESTTRKADNGKVIELVTKVEQYSPLSQVVNAPLPAERLSSRRRRLGISPALACIRALWHFQLQTARPYPNETHDDLALFTTIATSEHKNTLGLPHETLKSEVLRTFLQGVSTEVNPTCAMLGGTLAQDVINVIGQNMQPIQNILIWDGEEISGEIFAMHPSSPGQVSMAIPMQSVPLHTMRTVNGGDKGASEGTAVGTASSMSPS